MIQLWKKILLFLFKDPEFIYTLNQNFLRTFQMPNTMLYMGHAKSMHSNRHFCPKMSSSGTILFTFKMCCLTIFSILLNFIVIEFFKTVL